MHYGNSASSCPTLHAGSVHGSRQVLPSGGLLLLPLQASLADPTFSGTRAKRGDQAGTSAVPAYNSSPRMASETASGPASAPQGSTEFAAPLAEREQRKGDVSDPVPRPGKQITNGIAEPPSRDSGTEALPRIRDASYDIASTENQVLNDSPRLGALSRASRAMADFGVAQNFPSWAGPFSPETMKMLFSLEAPNPKGDQAPPSPDTAGEEPARGFVGTGAVAGADPTAMISPAPRPPLYPIPGLVLTMHGKSIVRALSWTDNLAAHPEGPVCSASSTPFANGLPPGQPFAWSIPAALSTALVGSRLEAPGFVPALPDAAATVSAVSPAAGPPKERTERQPRVTVDRRLGAARAR